MAEIQTAKTYYLGIHPYMLDPVSLEFSSFGVLWYEEGKQRYVVGYGFGTDQIETLFHFCRSSAYFTCSNEQVLYNIYTSIRVKQQERDWQTRKRLAFWTAFKEPWKSMPCGWYVLRSRDNFPCICLLSVKLNIVSGWSMRPFARMKPSLPVIWPG